VFALHATLYFRDATSYLPTLSLHRFHSNVHGEDDHPEDPRRIWRIYEALQSAGCTNRMIKIPSREATLEELQLIHTENHIESIQKTSGRVKRVARPVHHPNPTRGLLYHALPSMQPQTNTPASPFTCTGSNLVFVRAHTHQG